MAQRKQYALIDLLKLLSAVMIIAIHTQPFFGHESSVLYYPYAYLKCFAIPFFFVSSSYLFFSKYFNRTKQEKRAYLFKWLKRIGSLYGIYSLINLLIAIVTKSADQIFSLSGALRFIFLGEGNGYLWFVVALILAVVVQCLIYAISNKTIRMFLLNALFFGSLGLMIILQFYYHYFENWKIVSIYYSVFKDVRNVLSACFYVNLGVLCVLLDRLEPAKKRILLLLTPVIFVLSAAEYLFVVKLNLYKEEYSTLLIAAFIVFLMMVAVNVDIHIKDTLFIRKISSVMYFWQRYVIMAFLMLAQLTGNAVLNNHVVQFFAVLLICVGLTFFFEALKKTKLKKVISYLY